MGWRRPRTRERRAHSHKASAKNGEDLRSHPLPACPRSGRKVAQHCGGRSRKQINHIVRHPTKSTHEFALRSLGDLAIRLFINCLESVSEQAVEDASGETNNRNGA